MTTTFDDLIKKIDSTDISFKPLWQVTLWDKRFNGVDREKQPKVVNFKHVSAAMLKQMSTEDGNIALLSTGNYSGVTTEDRASQWLNNGEVISIPSGGVANIKYCQGGFVDSGNILAVANPDAAIKLKYVYYYLKNNTGMVQRFFRGAGIQHPDMRNILEIKIPVPPTEIQEEIIEALDMFVELGAELETELDARRKQYEHYRDELLLCEGCESKQVPLGDVAEYSKLRVECASLTPDTFVGVDNLLQNKMGKKPSEYVPGEGRTTGYRKGDILIGNIRPYLKKIWRADSDGGASGDILVIRSKSSDVSDDYLFHILSSDQFFDYDNSKSKGAKMPRGDKEAVMRYKITIPSLKRQREVVEALNPFEALVTDSERGLPAEIVARNKQYEYYRNKLLSIKDNET